MPFVSVILPIRNESQMIARCLEAVLGQDYPPALMEVFAVDGMSADGTREIVAALAARDRRLRLLDNPRRIVPTALNLGVRAAQGEIIIRVDGHTVIAPDYVRRCVETLARVDADCAGGPIRTVGTTRVARAIALAQSSPFGVGNAAFRYARRARYVDTLAFGAYYRQVFELVGLFDEELVRNQDDEFNFRLTRGGGRIWLDPSIQSTYYSRSTLRDLWSQYFGYGFWKVRVIQKHGRPAAWRHLVPPALVVALFGSLVAGALLRSAAVMLAVAGPYTLASLGASARLAARHGWYHGPVLALAFAAMHLAYGLGFLAGLARFGLRRGPRQVLPGLEWTN